LCLIFFFFQVTIYQKLSVSTVETSSKENVRKGNTANFV